MSDRLRPDGERDCRVRPKTLSVVDLFGILPYDGPTISVAEMDEAIAAGAAESAP